MLRKATHRERPGACSLLRRAPGEGHFARRSGPMTGAWAKMAAAGCQVPREPGRASSQASAQSGSMLLNVADNCRPRNPTFFRSPAQCCSMLRNVAHLSHRGRLALGPHPDSAARLRRAYGGQPSGAMGGPRRRTWHRLRRAARRRPGEGGRPGTGHRNGSFRAEPAVGLAKAGEVEESLLSQGR